MTDAVKLCVEIARAEERLVKAEEAVAEIINDIEVMVVEAEVTIGAAYNAILARGREELRLMEASEG
jgi:hypothetical protein